MAIQLTGISKAYGEHMVLEDFSCEIEEGRVTCIMGPSGQGKTTLLRIIMGLEEPDAGQIAGLENLRFSAVFQENRLCDNLTAAANIRLISRKPLRTSTIIEAMKAVELPPECARQTVCEMSGGQKRRVSILRALMAEYDVLFMDEPFKGLDMETKEEVMQYVKEQSRGKTVIMITHDESECVVMGGNIVKV